jgi:hypothetical protein
MALWVSSSWARGVWSALLRVSTISVSACTALVGYDPSVTMLIFRFCDTQKNTSITALDMRNNKNITDEGWKAFAAGLVVRFVLLF